MAQNNISTYLRGTGKAREGLGLVERTLSVMRESLGEDHPFALSCQVNKANCLHDLRRLTDAEHLQRETVERFKKTLGNNHPDTYVCEANLAIVLRAQGRQDEAEMLQLRVISGLSQVLGADHPSVTAPWNWKLRIATLRPSPRNAVVFRGDDPRTPDVRAGGPDKNRDACRPARASQTSRGPKKLPE